MKRAFTAVAVVYAVALAVALAVGRAVGVEHPIGVALAADLAATVAVFGASLAFRNSSFYDPYWSLAPIAIAVYWLARPESAGVNGARAGLVLGLVVCWGLRLTWSWARGWKGLGHEDWRYLDLRARSGRAYWGVSFVGIHLLPTLWVFAGCLSLYPALAVGTGPLGALDGLAAAVTGGAIWIEARADRELARFRAASPPREALLRSGLWSLSRHPNYFGEMGFWWGLYLFALAAAPGWGWTVVGPLSITLMFRFVSLPMIEARMLARRPDFAAHRERTSMVIPWFPRTPTEEREKRAAHVR